MSRWKWLAVLMAVVVAALAVVGSGRHLRRQHKDQYQECLSNVRTLAMVVTQYCYDHDDRMPLQSTYPHRLIPPGWKLKYSFVCPADPKHALPGYAFVPRWAGVKLDNIDSTGCAVMLYDANGAVPSYRHWADEWPECPDTAGPTPGLLVGYCDGHVLGNSAQQFTQRNIDAGRDSDYLAGSGGRGSAR